MEKFVKFSTLRNTNPGKFFPLIFFYLIILLLNFNCVNSTPDQDEDQRDKNLESYFINQILSQNPVQNSEIPTIKSLLLDMQKSIAALVAREYQRTAQMEELRDALNEFKKFKALVNPNGQNAIYQPPPPLPSSPPAPPPPPPVSSQPTKIIEAVSTSKEILEENSTDTMVITGEDEKVEMETTTAPPTSPTTTTVSVPVENNFGAEERRENLNQRTIGTGGGGGSGAALDGRVESLETEVRSTRNATYQFFQTYCQVTLDSLGVDTSDKNLKIVYSFCHQFQNVPAKPFLGEVISRPRARVYNGPNFTGDFEDFNIEGSLRPKCTSLTSKLSGKIRSMDTFGSCVRLYTDRYSCDGKSMAFYPRIGGQDSQQKEEKEQEILGRASSIGPCYDNELDHSYIELASPSTGSNGGQQQGSIKRFRKLTTLYKDIQIVPDFLVQIGRPTDFKPTYGYPVTQYKTGQNGRIDFISAHITQNDIRRGKRESSVVSEEAKTAFQNGYIYSEKMEGDLMGFYIGARLGPQKSLAFQNVFPQTAENQKMMLEQEQKIVNLPWSNDFHVSVQISVNYESDNGTRPIGFLYWTSHGRDQWSAIYMSNLHA